MVIVGITRKAETDEYRVFWNENRRDDEAKAYYADDPEDAVDTLIDVYERALESGLDIRLTEAQYTRVLISKYRWLWLQSYLKEGG